jgi:hypothetical protein
VRHSASALLVLLAVQMSVSAADLGDRDSDKKAPQISRFLANTSASTLTSSIPYRILMGPDAGRPEPDLVTPPVRSSPLARAIGKAARKSMIEIGAEASAEILIQCQQATSVVLTTPFMRSDSQQAHCYRF